MCVLPCVPTKNHLQLDRYKWLIFFAPLTSQSCNTFQLYQLSYGIDIDTLDYNEMFALSESGVKFMGIYKIP